MDFNIIYIGISFYGFYVQIFLEGVGCMRIGQSLIPGPTRRGHTPMEEDESLRPHYSVFVP